LASNKLLVHQLQSLARFLTVGLTKPRVDPEAPARRAAALFPLWHVDAHMLPRKSHPFDYLDLSGVSRDVESEVYEGAEERGEVFVEVGLLDAFTAGVKEAKREGGEVGRAASGVERALHLAEVG